MIKMHNVKYEEKWYEKGTLDISKEFEKEIVHSKYNIVDKDGNLLKFKFVGILVYRNEILIVLPKYLLDSRYNYSQLLQHAKSLIKVFKKLPKSFEMEYSDAFFITKDLSKNSISEIAIADFLIKDFFQHGILEKKYEVIKKGTNGKIDWTQTINIIQPYKSGKNIIYFETLRKQNMSNREEFITMLHNLVVEFCIEKYGDLLDIKTRRTSLSKITKRLSMLGSKEYILKMINNEMQNTFNERDIRVLKALYNFFSNENDSKRSNFQLYGTTKFHHIWETLCANAFRNQYNRYSSLIRPPLWKTVHGEKYTAEKNRIEPDILRSFVTADYKNIFFILDAKYYSIVLNNEHLKGQPGSYDIIKQYVYQIALEKELGKFDKVYNILVFPKISDETFKVFGTVQLDFFNVDPIINVYLSPNKLIELYLSNSYYDDNTLNIMIQQLNSSK